MTLTQLQIAEAMKNYRPLGDVPIVATTQIGYAWRSPETDGWNFPATWRRSGGGQSYIDLAMYYLEREDA